MQKILLIGQGSLGEYIKNQAILKNYKIVGTFNDSKKPNCLFLNICEINSIEKIVKNVNPDYIINCASSGDVDYLESHPEIAFNVNSLGAENIAKISHENKIRLIHISTDSVFDGIKGNFKETDSPNPVNIYGKSKYEGEKNILKICNDFIIIRTNFYGLYSTRKYFFNWILDNIKKNQSFLGFDDVIFTPLDVSTLSKMIILSLNINFNGILHFSSDTPISKYNFIKNTLNFFELKNSLKKGSIESAQSLALRPKNTSLNNEKSKEFIKIQIPSYNDWFKQNKDLINRYLNN
jgi:dTDP-4-dehydrorhamnose reductase